MLTRRQTMLGGGAVVAGAALFSASACAQTDPLATPLPIPPLVDALAQGNALSLNVQAGRHAFFPRRPTPTYGYSGDLLGPTIRVRSGNAVAIAVRNAIETATTIHWHGLVIPGESGDGGPHDRIAPGETWRRVLPIDQREATAWYHPHPHQDTARQIYAGLGGLMFVEDGTGERLGLPRTYGEDDLPLILQDRLFDSAGGLIYPTGPMTLMQGARGDTFVVNGAIAPSTRVPAGLVRLRLLNAANARNFVLSFEDGRSFHIIASDGGYLAAPVEATNLLIAPAERYEILVDFSDGRAVRLGTSADPYTPMTGMMGRAPNASGAIMTFVPDRSRQTPQHRVPAALVSVPSLPRSDTLQRRRLTLNDMGGMMGGMMGPMMGRGPGGGFGINGQAFDMERIDAEIRLGSREIWEVAAGMMAHPFHLHGAHFRLLSLDGAPPPAQLSGWKDTVLVSRFAEILVHFAQPSSRTHPFMFHCHILEHEDAGMMGQYVCA
ncbi:MAG: multicopper oxidase domain-containing protein [Hyphomonadaceae bacterium]|nr:multicopper oxidase domain-containing protein [Hyphomonadaceae bacterium]